jgi:hypothetical protein
MRGLIPIAAAVAIALAESSTVLVAQETTSSIRGNVTNATGDAVAGALVTIVHTPSGTTSTVTTGSGGTFNASGLRPGGPYMVTVAAAGFDAVIVDDLFLSVGQPLSLPLQLGGTYIEEISVIGKRVSMEMSSGPTTNFTRDKIEAVASVNHDIRDIARRDPFASFNPTNRGVTIAGQNNRTNRFSVDGVRFSDNFGLQQGGLPTVKGPVPFDAVEQMSVKIAPFDVSEGDFQGGSINVVLRSGTNEFEGNAFYAHTDDSLTGDEFRGTPVGLDFKSRNYGGFFAGPIIENKLFFATAYERTKAGDPANFGLPGAPTPVPNLTQEDLDNVAGIVSSVYGYDVGGVRRTLPEDDEKYTVKLDWNATDGQRLSYTLIKQNTYQQSTNSGGTGVTTPAAGVANSFLQLSSNSTHEPEKVTSHVLQLNSDWTSRYGTELRLNYRESSKIPSSLGASDMSQFQICLAETPVGSRNLCDAQPKPAVYAGVDLGSQADVVAQEQYGMEFVNRYDVGNHSVKALVGFSALEITNLFVLGSLGRYTFDSLEGLAARQADEFQWQFSIADSAYDLSLPHKQRLDSVAASFDYDQYTFGIQDSWDVLPNLNLNFGVRLDKYRMKDAPPENTYFIERYASLYPGLTNTKNIDGHSVLQPRIGFSWTPLADLRVRGGLGLFNGGSPDVWLGNIFSVAGVYTNTMVLTRSADGSTCNANAVAAEAAGYTVAEICAAALDNVTGKGTELPANTVLVDYLKATAGTASPVNVLDPDFSTPTSWKASVSVDYTKDFPRLGDGWNFGFDIYKSQVKKGLAYKDLRLEDSGNRTPDGRIIYRYLPAAGPLTTAGVDLLLYNTDLGESTITVARVGKSWDNGISANLSYTHQNVKSVSDMLSSGSGLTGGTTGNGSYSAAPSALDPNVAVYGTSFYEIEHSLKFNLDFSKVIFGDNVTRVSLYWERRSGTPYSLTMSNGGGNRSLFGLFNTSGTNQRYLLYVPDVSAIDADPRVTYANPAVYESLRDYVLANGLPQGEIIGKNTMRSPDYSKVDLHVEQELGGGRFNIYADFENLMNLIDDDYGTFRYYNPLSPVVGVSCVGVPSSSYGTGAACPQYSYDSFNAPVLQNGDSRISLWNVRMGFRVRF